MNTKMNILEYNKLYSFSLGPAAGPADGGSRPAGHPRSGPKVGWVPDGIYGHLPDPLHASWDHPATFLGCVQVRSMQFGSLCFFGRIRLRQKEGVTRIYESKRRRLSCRPVQNARHGQLPTAVSCAPALAKANEASGTTSLCTPA